MGRASRAALYASSYRGDLLLAKDAGRYRMLCANLSCLSTRQDRTMPRQRSFGATHHSRTIVGEHYMDFITGLPKFDGYGTIMLVVDRFSKYATFMPATPGCISKEAAHLFFKNVVKYWGLPRHIISDRDSRFIGNFWRELFQTFGTELHSSTSFHPQTDGQIERVNTL